MSDQARTRVPTGPLGDVLVVLGTYAVLGVVAGLAWAQLAPELVATRTDTAVVLEPDQLQRQVGVDGWYAVLGLAGGLLAGAVLVAWRRARPVLLVVLVGLGGLLAGYLAVWVGLAAGPPDTRTVLADRAVGATAPLDLTLQARGLLGAWPVASLLGALVYLVVRGPDPVEEAPADGHAADDPQATVERRPSGPAAR